MDFSISAVTSPSLILPVYGGNGTSLDQFSTLNANNSTLDENEFDMDSNGFSAIPLENNSSLNLQKELDMIS